MKDIKVYRNKQELIHTFVKHTDTVLDVGFLGQGIKVGDPKWPHSLLLASAQKVHGVDLEIDRTIFPDESRYKQMSAEKFSFPGITFDVIFAGDLIEHLANPGLFLESCRAHMHEQSQLILTTPNCFNLFNIAEKFSKDEPTVNADHTCYFNYKTLHTLLLKSGMSLENIAYVYSLEYTHKESWKKKLLNALYALLAKLTPKYLETLVVVVRTEPSSKSHH